jgi:integrase
MSPTELTLFGSSDRAQALADRALSDRTRDRLERSVPENTRRAYARQWTQFANWCAAQGRTDLPATGHTLAEYASHLADLDRAPATIEQAVAAVRTAHRTAGYRQQPDTGDALAVLKVHKQDRAEAGKRKRKAAPVTLEPLRAMVETADPGTLAGKRDRALLVLGFAMMARRSELAALRIADIRFTEDGLTVTVRASKTDQDAEGAEVNIPAGVHPDTDPVRVVRAWLAALAELDMIDGQLLRSVDRWGRLGTGMTGEAVNEAVQRRAAAAGLEDAGTYSAHGLRAGGPTEAARAGHPVSFIAEHGRWSKSSPVVYEYVRAVDKWRDNPMRGIGL